MSAPVKDDGHRQADRILKKFGGSPSPLRQGAQVLGIMGVISQRVGDGTYLSAGVPSILIEPMEFLILLDGVSFRELMEARLIVEPELLPKMSRN